MEAKIEKIPKCMEAKNMLLNNQRVTEKVKEKKKRKKKEIEIKKTTAKINETKSFFFKR